MEVRTQLVLSVAEFTTYELSCYLQRTRLPLTCDGRNSGSIDCDWFDV